MNKQVTVIGGGLAGSECAYFLAEHGYKVTLFEMKPVKFSPAHHSKFLAEVVCSNSFKSEDELSSSGMLKKEMELFNSLILNVAKKTKVPSGGALSVDREKFSKEVDRIIRSHLNITVINKEITSLNFNEPCVIATGPLTSDALSKELFDLLGEEGLSFYDASSPIVLKESLDKNAYFIEDRYGTVGEGDYINCPLTKEEYLAFYNELINAERVELHNFEKGEIFEGCMPIEVMASRGIDSLRFGPLKPVGLGGHLKEKPYAIVQLRKENIEEESYNLVGFQTNLKFGEQKRVFSMIPALKNAEFIKYGVMHRNTFINSPKFLNANLSLKSNPNIFIAGQLSGVEGYMESTASGLMVALSIVLKDNNQENNLLGGETMLGALREYITNPCNENAFQPMNSNYGIIKPIEEKIKDKKEKRRIVLNRSLERICAYIKENNL